MNEMRKDCPMRHKNGNCTTVGGFCTAVNDSICARLQNAYDCGYRAAAIARPAGDLKLLSSYSKAVESNAPLTLEELRQMDGELEEEKHEAD